MSWKLIFSRKEEKVALECLSHMWSKKCNSNFDVHRLTDSPTGFFVVAITIRSAVGIRSGAELTLMIIIIIGPNTVAATCEPEESRGKGSPTQCPCR